MEQFEYKSLKEQKKMTLDELKTYHKALRKYEYETDKEIKGIELRKKTYYIIKFLLQIDKLIQRRSVTIIGDKRTSTDKPKIFACTHIGRFDIESAIEAMGEAAWFIMGDPGETYRNFDGFLLDIYGRSGFEMDDKFDAHTVNVRQTKILNQGGNELCFPEAAWNLDPIYPVGEIHPGVVRRAIKTGAVIVPVGIEQYRTKHRKKYYVNIGENLDFSGASLSDAEELSEVVREHMISLKWDIFEKYGQAKRNDMDENWYKELQKFIESIMIDTENGYTIEEIERTKYKSDKEKPETPNEVFSYLENIQLNNNNTFLASAITAYNEANVLKKKL